MKNFEVNTETMEIKLSDNIPSAAADYVVNRCENYYELNGLADDGLSVDDDGKNRIIYMVWDKKRSIYSVKVYSNFSILLIANRMFGSIKRGRYG